jgi:hypothetical protein
MTFEFSPLTLARPTSEYLAGGRSPAEWRGMTERYGMAAGWLFRSCSWAGFLSQVVPCLQTGPLFGSGLEALTTDALHREIERQFRSSRHRFTPVPPPRPGAAAERRSRTAGKQSDPKHGPAPYLKQSQRASREFLTRLAGRAFAVKEQAQVGTSGHSRLVKEQIEMLGHKSAGNRRALKEVADNRVGTLVRTLVERAALAIAAPGAHDLAEQWCTPLNGPQAPRELLEAAVTPGRTTRSTKAPMSRATVDRIPWRDESPWSGAGANARPSPELFRTEIMENAATGALETEKEAVSGLPVMRSRALPSNMGRLSRQQPPASAGSEESCEEDIMSDEDLSVLSGKIKRILEEEARRHGIDV